jgi:REP element-mobilizing transposase RayT
VSGAMRRFSFPSPTFHEVQSRGSDEQFISILAYALLPNHYHLLFEQFEQRKENGISTFMQKLRTGYTMYFNTKYGHSGALFQGRFKNTTIERDAQFMHIPHYIHLNTLDATLPNLRERNLGEKEIRSANE